MSIFLKIYAFTQIKGKAGGFRKDSLLRRRTNEQRTKTAALNPKYKNTFFRMLFREKEELMKLYNAVNDSAYTDADQFQIVTLENAVYMNMKNDLAFLVDFQLHLYEHQSTKNPNMPLRNLFYVAKQYQNMVKEESIYSRRLVKLPTPRFVVFYNGTEKQPEQQKLRLSDAYDRKEGGAGIRTGCDHVQYQSGL